MRRSGSLFYLVSICFVLTGCLATVPSQPGEYSPSEPGSPSSASESAPETGDRFEITSELRVRDPRIGPNTPRAAALLETEVAGLERLFQHTPATSPDYPTLVSRLGRAWSELALARAMAGKSDDARSARAKSIEYYENLSAQDHPYAADALYYTALEYDLSGDQRRARAHYYELIQKFPKSEHIPLAYLGFGELFAEEIQSNPSKRELATLAYAEVLKYPPPENRGHCYAALRLAEVTQSDKDYSRAAHCADSHPKLPESGAVLALAKSRGGDPSSWEGLAVSSPPPKTTVVSGGATAPSAALVSTAQNPPVYKANEPRIALVIGNAHYDTSPLANPINDARAMARTLESLSFDVTIAVDADQKTMKNAIRDFGTRLRSTRGVGLFFFAGHGMQVNGENYLIPVRAPIDVEADVAIETVPLGSVLAKMDGAGNRLNLVILDACRNNPFARSFRSSSRGLALTDAPMGTYISYATAPGRVAADGSGSHGVFTEAILKHIATKGKSVESLFMSVRSDVVGATNGQQMPWSSSSLTTEFFFAGN